MRFGFCMPQSLYHAEGKPYSTAALEADAALMDAGFDYGETTAYYTMDYSEEDLQILAEKKQQGLFHAETCNCFLPASLRLADGPTREELRRYVERLFGRLQRLQVDTVVFGSGDARRRPDTVTAEQMQEITVQFLRMCAPLAEQYGLTVVLEPLSQSGTNYINTVREGAALIRAVDRDRIRLLADSYHMGMENEPFDVLKENADLFRLLHIAEGGDRSFPGKHGGDEVKQFAAVVKAIGYDGRITAECGYDDDTLSLADACTFIRSCFR